MLYYYTSNIYKGPSKPGVRIETGIPQDIIISILSEIFGPLPVVLTVFDIPRLDAINRHYKVCSTIWYDILDTLEHDTVTIYDK